MPPLLLFLRQSVSGAVNTVIELTGAACERRQAFFLSSEAWENRIPRISYTDQSRTHIHKHAHTCIHTDCAFCFHIVGVYL